MGDREGHGARRHRYCAAVGCAERKSIARRRGETRRALEEDSRRGIAAVAESERTFSANHDAPGTMFCAAQGRSEACAVREARCPPDARSLTGPESIKGSDSNWSGRGLDG